MSNVNTVNTSRAERMEQIDLGPTKSLQFQFAKLQLLLAEEAKKGALSHMNDIQQTQQEQQKVADIIAKARTLREEIVDKKKTTLMPKDMKDYMDEHKIPYDTKGDDYHNKEEWDYNLKSLQNYQEQLGTDTQQKMVFVQDFMGQYNSYLQGANTQISQANQTLTSIARGQ